MLKIIPWAIVSTLFFGAGASAQDASVSVDETADTAVPSTATSQDDSTAAGSTAAVESAPQIADEVETTTPKKYYLSSAGNVTGPFTAEEIKEKLDNKIIHEDAMAAEVDTTEWISVSEVIAAIPQPEIATATESEPETLWYVAHGGQTLGPFPESKINEMIAGKEVVETTDVIKAGTQNWVKAKTVFPQFNSATNAPLVDAGTDMGDWQYKRSPSARGKLLQIGISLVASGAVLMLSAVGCAARGDAPEGAEWALDDGTCAGVLLSSGAIVGVISIPFFIGANAKKKPIDVNVSFGDERVGLALTKTF
ncbi:MAG: DUF4339 domain-containing protein [Deltaproteobacteria bacterium]|nr:DUF4339 domain-containing protein [Deltaproteobacteria bacterium]MBN2672229.1 DUF4339 domain-containing protein [Deltaproteobacteria bacterium]